MTSCSVVEKEMEKSYKTDITELSVLINRNVSQKINVISNNHIALFRVFNLVINYYMILIKKLHNIIPD